MKKKLLILSLMIAAFSCSKEDNIKFPLIHTGEVTDIHKEGAVFNAKIVDLGKGVVAEIGFVWDSLAGPTVESSEKMVIQEPPKTGVISEPISNSLRTGVKYYVRAYIKNNNFITYGKEVSFISLGSKAPAFSNITPKKGNLGDTLLLLGSNFNFKAENNQVRIGGFEAPVVKASQDTLLVLVPQNLNAESSEVSVNIDGKEAVAKDKFNLIPPVINGFDPKVGSFGSRIVITGMNFSSHPSSLHVYFNTVEAQVLEKLDEQLVVVVPDSLDKRQRNIRVSMNNLLVSSSEEFELEALSIHDFEPKVAVTGSTIILKGNNFSPVASNNKVTIGGRRAPVTYASPNQLKVKLPLQDSSSYPGRVVKVQVEVMGHSREYSDTFLINDKWFRLQNAPVSENTTGFTYSYTSPNYFVHNGKAYIGLNNNSDFWEFDVENNSWSRLSDFPGTPRLHGVGFAIDNKIYFGTGSGNGKDLKDWWEYDIASDTWNQKNDFGGEKRTGAVAFQVDDAGYLGSGFLMHVHYYHGGFSDFWKYSPTFDIWEKVTNYPFGMWWGIAVPGSQTAIVGLGNARVSGNYEKRVYKFSPASNSWQRIANYPFAEVNNDAIGFELENITYVKTSYSDDFYYFDELSASWQRLQTDVIAGSELGIAFSIGGKAFVGLGKSKTMWEYDPSR